MFTKRNKWKKLMIVFIILNLLLGFGGIITPDTVYASEETVFTIKINDVEEESFTMADLRAMPAITKAYGSTGYYVRRGVDFLELLGSLEIDYDNWQVKLIMRDGSSILNFSTLVEPLLAYEESQGDSDFFPFSPPNLLKLYHGDGTNQNLVYGYVIGIEVTKPETLTPPVLEADSTDNTVGKPIDLIFEDDEIWRDAITEVTVDGSALESDDYIIEAGKLTIDGSVFAEAGDYEIAVKATGYEDADVTQVIVKGAVGKEPPVLTASTSGNTVGNPIVIKHSEEWPWEWEPAVAAVFVDGVQLESGQYNIEHGRLTISAGIFNEVKDYIITVQAPDYQDAIVTQTIKARPERFVSEGKGNIVFADCGKGNNTVAIKNDGTVWAWGDGKSGKLGDGTTGSGNWRSVPGQVSELTNVTSIASGEIHTLALKDDGTVWAWGSNSSGILGNEGVSEIFSSVPVQVITDSETGAVLTDIKAIAAGGVHSLALMENGTVWTWGKNNYGQLGDGKGSSLASSNVPVQVITDLETGAVLTDIKAIAAGDVHSLALKEDGTVWAWGRNNNYGQLGNGSKENSSVPVQVMVDPEAATALTDIKAIAAGISHSFALKEDGTVWAWGWNGNGQIGNGGTADSSVPVRAARLIDIQSISAGANHIMALKNDNTIWGWGSDYYGQLGIETDATCYIPIQLCESSDIAMISAGYYHSLVVKNDGTVWTWGQNTKGKLGNGTTENYPDDVPIPTQVKLAPQAIVPAVESATLGDFVELGFIDDTAWRESITAVSVDEAGLDGEQYAVEEGKITIMADVFTEIKEHTITIKASGFLDAIIEQRIIEGAPKYDITPEENPVYTIGETGDGIRTMTVKPNQTGLEYFAVAIESIEPHEGTETIIFAHFRDRVQLQLNALEADFDEVSTAKAGFNVKPGDVIKVYIVDELTNDGDRNPIILQ